MTIKLLEYLMKIDRYLIQLLCVFDFLAVFPDLVFCEFESLNIY